MGHRDEYVHKLLEIVQDGATRFSVEELAEARRELFLLASPTKDELRFRIQHVGRVTGQLGAIFAIVTVIGVIADTWKLQHGLPAGLQPNFLGYFVSLILASCLFAGGMLFRKGNEYGRRLLLFFCKAMVIGSLVAILSFSIVAAFTFPVGSALGLLMLPFLGVPAIFLLAFGNAAWDSRSFLLKPEVVVQCSYEGFASGDAGRR